MSIIEKRREEIVEEFVREKKLVPYVSFYLNLLLDTCSQDAMTEESIKETLESSYLSTCKQMAINGELTGRVAKGYLRS